ncbi:molybdopterin-guanine dinucleotide biosynthesis protein B [Rhabdochromatium marinum]|uniref:molybdopterin-guanine dinucleotide biosynthesis protein B n=1 Tax=Rhabdochromatium marinum TaxID=48729 RepID=UPI001904E135
MPTAQVAHVGFAAPSGTGKTTLISQLVPVLRARGLRLGYLKHAHHGFDLDTPGKDTYRLRAAGAASVLIASPERWAMLEEGGQPGPGAVPRFEALLSRFDAATTDLVLIEGWHGAAFPRIAVHRAASGREMRRLDDPDLIAIATDAPHQIPGNWPEDLPRLPLNEPECIADFILNHPLMTLHRQRAHQPQPVAAQTLHWAPAPTDVREQLVFYYRLLRRYGYNDAQSGNASVRDGEFFWVTPSGASGDELCPADLLSCPLHGDLPERASFDAALHRAVYQRQPEARGILHSHGAYSIAASCVGTEFAPVDFEGRHYFSRVPIVPIPQSFEAYCAQVPERVAAALNQSCVAMVATHGVYAWGQTLRAAYQWTCALEHSAKIQRLLSMTP